VSASPVGAGRPSGRGPIARELHDAWLDFGSARLDNGHLAAYGPERAAVAIASSATAGKGAGVSVDAPAEQAIEEYFEEPVSANGEADAFAFVAVGSNAEVQARDTGNFLDDGLRSQGPRW
jgi:hypothetical protein